MTGGGEYRSVKDDLHFLDRTTTTLQAAGTMRPFYGHDGYDRCFEATHQIEILITRFNSDSTDYTALRWRAFHG